MKHLKTNMFVFFMVEVTVKGPLSFLIVKTDERRNAYHFISFSLYITQQPYDVFKHSTHQTMDW